MDGIGATFVVLYTIRVQRGSTKRGGDETSGKGFIASFRGISHPISTVPAADQALKLLVSELDEDADEISTVPAATKALKPLETSDQQQYYHGQNRHRHAMPRQPGHKKPATRNL